MAVIKLLASTRVIVDSVRSIQRLVQVCCDQFLKGYCGVGGETPLSSQQTWP